MTLLSLQRNQRKISFHQQYPPLKIQLKKPVRRALKTETQSKTTRDLVKFKKTAKVLKKSMKLTQEDIMRIFASDSQSEEEGGTEKEPGKTQETGKEKSPAGAKKTKATPPFHSCLQMKSQRQRQQRTNHPNLQRRPQRNLTRTLVRAANFLD